MNKQKLSLLGRFIYVLLIILYVAILFVSIRAIIRIPNEYEDQQKQQTQYIKKKITKGIKESDRAVFTKLDKETPIEFIVFDDTTKKTVYTTLPEKSLVELKGKLSENAVAAEIFFKVDNNGQTYKVWIVQYNISPQNVVNAWMTRVIGIVFLLAAINLIVIIVLLVKFVHPIKRLKENVTKISRYQLNLISTENGSEYDNISNQLVMFARDLEQHISETELSYTTLEKNLQIQNEKLDYRTRMIAALTHDLKTPLSNIVLSMEHEKQKNPDDKELEIKYNQIQQNVQEVIKNINDISKFVYQDNYIDFFKKEKFDVIKLFVETYNIFRMKYKEKNFNVQNEIDESLVIDSIRLSFKQLIHNALSNIAAYGADNGEVILSCYKKDDYLYMGFYNEAKPLMQEQLDNIFKLFYRVAETENNSGIGLYTIKNTTRELGGFVNFKNVDKGVLLEIHFKLVKEDQDEEVYSILSFDA